MMRFLTLLMASLLTLAIPVSAQASDMCQEDEVACILDAAWGAALILPAEKQARLKPIFVELAARAGDADLMQAWAIKLSVPPASPGTDSTLYEDFGWTNAEAVISEYGIDGLIRFAKEKRAPLHYGRGDALLSAGKHIYKKRPQDAARLNEALFELAGAASDFERPELAHAAAELAMYRCDRSRFDRALSMTHAPNNLRYALWRARMTGNAAGLATRIRSEADSEDTRHVRQVLDGYGAIVELGYCQ